MNHLITITWQHIRRSPYQALAAVMIMMLTIFIGLTFFLLSLGSQKLLVYLEHKPQVIAFFNDTVTSEDQVRDLENQLKAGGKVNAVTFVSKDQALAIYKDRNKSDPLLLELVSANTLPASLEVSAKTVADLPALYSTLSKAPNIEEISYQRDVVNSLIGALDRIRKFGVGLIGFLVVTSMLTILTIIGMKIALRRDEIEVERLVGASTWYVRAPFLFEGFFYGAVGAIISWGLIYAIIFMSTPYLLPYLSGLALLPLNPLLMVEILGGTIVAGGLVGVVGSFLAVWRYLK